MSVTAAEQLALDEQADFEGGFNEDEGVAQVPVVTDPQPIPPAEPVVEIVETVAEVLNINPLQIEKEKLETRVRNIEGKYGELKGKFGKQQEAFDKQMQEALKSMPSSDDLENKPLDEISELYPAWANAIKRSSELAVAEAVKQMREIQQETPVDMTAELSQIKLDLHQELRLMPIEIAHPGWKETTTTPTFVNWLKVQTDDSVALSRSSAPGHSIQLIDRFVAAQEATIVATQAAPLIEEFVAATQAPPSVPVVPTPPMPTPPKPSRLEAALAPPRRNTVPPPAQQKTEEDEFLQGFESG